MNRALVAAACTVALLSATACGRSSSAAPLTAASRVPSLQPATPPSSAGQKLVAATPPPSSPPQAVLGKTSGNVIYEDWVRRGRAIHISPDAGNIKWPLAHTRGRMNTIRLATAVPPASVEVLFFTGVNSHGQPASDGRTEQCRPKPAARGCSFGVVGNHVVVEVASRSDAETYLLLGVDWFVPVDVLRSTPGAAASDAAKYTFRVVLEQGSAK